MVTLSRDHKASDEDEKSRIINCGGRVQPYMDDDGSPIGPDRVWLKEKDSPGLAMTRAFGDRSGILAVIIHQPEI